MPPVSAGGKLTFHLRAARMARRKLTLPPAEQYVRPFSSGTRYPLLPVGDTILKIITVTGELPDYGIGLVIGLCAVPLFYGFIGAIGAAIFAALYNLIAEAQVVATHQRVFTRDHSACGKTIYDWRHYLSVVQRKPGALRNGAPFTELPDSFRQLQAQLLKRPGGDREMADVLALVLHHDEALVERAVRETLDTEVVTKTHILNRLSRLLDQRPPALTTPPALTLSDEPRADTERYDHLREGSHVR